MTESAKAARRQYEREWRAKNPEKVRARNERYWARKAAQMQLEQEQSDAKENEK